MIDLTKKPWRKVPLAEITTPKAGLVCYPASWWLVIDECVLFYGSSPQCNTDRRVVDYMLTKRQYPGAEVRELGITFLPRRD